MIHFQADAPVVVIDDKEGIVNLLPAKLKSRADKLMAKAQSAATSSSDKAPGAVADEDVEIVDVHKTVTTPRQPWGPTQQLPPLVPGEYCYARANSNPKVPFRKALLKCEVR